MADNNKKPLPNEEEEEYEEIETFTLTDEDGNESEFELLDTAELDGVTYYAMQELDENGEPVGDEYVILRVETDENGEEYLSSIDDDEEFDRVADYFDDQFSDIDYDN
jgi:uncharacterized protein YrzB (UPF0473 family)